MQGTSPITDQILRRIRNEFIEMPGPRLTVRQAQRLWGLDAETCRQAIKPLIEAKFLCSTGIECYRRLTECVVTFPASRTVRMGTPEAVIKYWLSGDLLLIGSPSPCGCRGSGCGTGVLPEIKQEMTRFARASNIDNRPLPFTA